MFYTKKGEVKEMIMMKTIWS